MPQESVKPNDRAIGEYYALLHSADSQDARHEGNVRQAFQMLLNDTARIKNWTLVAELSERIGDKGVRYDGVLRDQYKLPHGYWEAKDTSDDLIAEIRKKIERGYTLKNTIFEDTREGVLFQDGREIMRANLHQPEQLSELLNRFYSYDMPPFRDFDEAVRHFQGEIPHIAGQLNERVKEAHKSNSRFQKAYADFFTLCQTALNPNISQDAVDEMLIQHMLTERLIVRVFDMERFTRQNVVAAEIEKVIDALTSRHFNYREFLGALDRFYDAIERAADELADFSEKQHFLDTVYERFFQGYSVKLADTHGIVYTPQPIVDFMCAAVEEVLRDEFGKSLGDPGVNILDPCTGTGNFIVNLLRRIPKRDLKRAYREQLFANEVMLMPYYIASLNIEHAYHELTGEYESFEGICFVDTLELAEGSQMRLAFLTEKNSARVERQKAAPITVIIGNPPYNVGQQNENDNNKNRKYEVIGKRVKETYSKDSKASSKSKLDDPYIKFFRWATDRLNNQDGVVCFVSNSGFIDKKICDGMRKHLLDDFSRIYIIDLKGDIRKDSMRDGIPLGEKHTVFGLAAMVGISIAVLVRNRKHAEHKLFYSSVDWRSTREEKFEFLRQHVEIDGKKNALNTVAWQELQPDVNHTWLVPENADEYASYLPMGSKEIKKTKGEIAGTLFKTYSLGLNTNRDNWAYNFDPIYLGKKITESIEIYNSEIDRWKRAKKPKNIDNFVINDEAKIKWSSRLKETFVREEYASFDESKIRTSIYRPFTKQYAFFDKIFNQRQGFLPRIFPDLESEKDNCVICVVNEPQIPFSAQITNCIPALHYGGRQTQCFPFYIYDLDGTNRRENITGWALAQFRARYGDESIIKWDIFYYIYALLHHPEYRERYANNLNRDLPRIPFAPDFRAFAEAGNKLADLHLNYETVEPYRLEWVTNDKPISWRVEKMRLISEKTALQMNDTLTLSGIPPEAFDYRLGNRSALEWIIAQYQASTDKPSGIISDPNRLDDPEYIVHLIERIVRVSMETVAIVRSLPALITA